MTMAALRNTSRVLQVSQHAPIGGHLFHRGTVKIFLPHSSIRTAHAFSTHSKRPAKMSSTTTLSGRPQLKVLISGAGIAGPCLAYWLTRTGLDVSVTIVERSPQPRVTGQAIDVRGPAIEIVRRMGLQEAMRARHTTEEGTVFVNSMGKTFANFPGTDNFTAEYEILRADLSELFLEATQGRPSIKYVYGDYVKSMEQNEKRVDVAFNNGSTESFDVVVGADGSTSKIRDMILSEEDRKDCYQFIGQYVAFFSIPRQADDKKLWYWYGEPKGLGVMTRPHRNNETNGAYMIITTPKWGHRDLRVEEAMAQGPEATKQMLREYFTDLKWETPRILAGLDQADDFYMSKAARVRLPRWTNNRATLLGDAAHATFGIGTSLAIDGAYILAGELSKIQSNDDVPQALQRFESVFRPIFQKVDGPMFGFPQCAFPQTRWALTLRDSILWAISKARVYKIFNGSDKSENDFELPSYDWVDN